MAIIENFYKMTEEQRLSIYNKIEMKQLNEIDLNSLFFLLKLLNI